VPAVAASADDRMRLPGAAGVADWVRGLLERGGRMPRARSGIPHSIIVDEAHYFFGARAV